MLCELAVADLGVIEELSLVFGPGMTALTGETGAGKTLLVEAIELLVGGRADSTMVRSGASETVVEGRFVLDDEEVVLRRVVPHEGRSRAYVNGRLAAVAELADRGRALVDLHGQHAHQSLLSGAVQRTALDRFGGIDLEPLRSARRQLAAIEERLGALGGDERERARELELVRFQLAELDGARIDDPGEDGRLEIEEAGLGDALAHREASIAASAALGTDGGTGDSLGMAIGALKGRAPFSTIVMRLEAIAAELGDVTAELRRTGESIEDDPARLAEVRERRRMLRDLERKYGETLAQVMVFRDELAERATELETMDTTAQQLEAQRDMARDAVAAAEADVGGARRRAAPLLAEAVRTNLVALALDKARLEVEVGDDPGDRVEYRISTNPGSPPMTLAKVASGGELARTMLALRLVLHEAPDTLVFDEVDAGIGGTAAIAVGRSLATLGRDHQVLVVTHLAQVAAAADHQLVVSKEIRDGHTFTSISPVDGHARVVELARMLSGTPDSAAALDHARALLDPRQEGGAASVERALR